MLTPQFFAPIVEPAEQRAKLYVIVDTEEEFDWSAPLGRQNVSVSAIPETRRLQDVAGLYGVKPTYVVDYPVATTRSSSDVLTGFVKDGACCIGAHLHPWVNPPFDEPLTSPMSFACNLGASIEQAKIAVLSEAINEHMLVRPRVYKAGRYGFGPTSAAITESLGYDVDASVIPHMDFSRECGPDFSGFPVQPSTFGERRRLLELPCTTGFTGTLRSVGGPVHRLASASWMQSMRAVGILARTRVLNKIMLSPEGNTFDEMRSLARALYGDGLRTFAMTFHSPSLSPGCTPYVRTAADRDAFVSTIDRFFDFFFSELNGEPTTAEALFDRFVAPGAPTRSGSTSSPIHHIPS